MDGKLILLSVFNSLGARWDCRYEKPQVIDEVVLGPGPDHRQHVESVIPDMENSDPKIS